MLQQTFSLSMKISLACLLASCALTMMAQNLLYVGNSRGDDISIIDIASLKVVATSNSEIAFTESRFNPAASACSSLLSLTTRLESLTRVLSRRWVR
jgi:YVTN family beta-propeller protein